MWKKILGKKFCEKNLRKKILEQKFWNKILEKSFDKKNFRKINYKTKIFKTKIYSNIDKCHTIFALLALFDKTGRKTGSNDIVRGIWFKIGSVGRSHWTQGMWRFERSREKRYITACELSVTRLPHEWYLLHRWYGILVPALRPRKSAEHLVEQESRALYTSAAPVVRCRIYRCQYIGFNSRCFSGTGINVIKSYVWRIIFWISTTTTVP